MIYIIFMLLMKLIGDFPLGDKVKALIQHKVRSIIAFSDFLYF